MNGSDESTRPGDAPSYSGSVGGHFSASKCPECYAKKSSRIGWRKRRGWLVCAECVGVIDSRTAALERMADNARELGLTYD